jgi:hypothetical protein
MGLDVAWRLRWSEAVACMGINAGAEAQALVADATMPELLRQY